MRQTRSKNNVAFLCTFAQYLSFIGNPDKCQTWLTCQTFAREKWRTRQKWRRAAVTVASESRRLRFGDIFFLLFYFTAAFQDTFNVFVFFCFMKHKDLLPLPVSVSNRVLLESCINNNIVSGFYHITDTGIVSQYLREKL